jgi:sugar phosphate isomerase/epimerase
MNLMICMRGEPEQTSFLPEIAALGAGIELGSYGMVGIRSEEDWGTRYALHQAVRSQFRGLLAIHGPFLGMEFSHPDYLIREVVKRRLDMTLDAAVNLQASRVILHSSYKPEIEIFNLQEIWLKGCVEFWRQEIRHWAEAGILVVLENDLEKSPDLLVRLVDEVDHPSLKLCLDIGHQNVFSDVRAPEWVQRLGTRLAHVHVHDNDGRQDRHWSLGRGTIDFEPFYAALLQHAPETILSLEVEDNMEVKMADLRQLAARFLPK